MQQFKSFLFVRYCLLDCFLCFLPGFCLVLLFVLLVMPCFLLAKMVPDRILSVNASIDTIGDILLKIIPTLEEVSHHDNYLVNYVYVNRGQVQDD